MNVGFKFEWPWGDEYYAFQTVDISGNQYEGKIKAAGPLVMSISEDGQYPSSEIEIAIDDPEPWYLKVRLADEDSDNVYGTKVTEYDTDGNTLTSKFLERFSYEDSKLRVVISDYFSEMNNVITDKPITVDEFPSANRNSWSQNFNYFSGHFMTSGTNRTNCLKAPYVNKSATYKYLVGIPMNGTQPTLNKAFRGDTGADVTGACTLQWDATNGYVYINYAVAVEYLEVNIQYSAAETTAAEILTEVGSTFFSDYTFDVTGVETLLDDRHYQWPSTIITAQRHFQPHYAVNKLLTGNQILNELCTALNLEYTIDASKNIVFHVIDFSSMTADETIETGKISSFDYEDLNTERLVNKVIINNRYNYVEDSFKGYSTQTKQESFDRYGVYRTKEINNKISPEKVSSDSYLSFSETTAKYKMIEYKDPPRIATITIPIGNIGNRIPTEYLSFSHPDAVDNTTRLYIIENISNDSFQDLATYRLRDIQHLTGLSVNDKMLLQTNSFIDESTVFADKAISGNSFFLAATGAQHTTGTAKYMNSSADGDGSSAIITDRDWLNYSDFHDILNQTNWTIEFWVRFTATGKKGMMNCTNGVTNYWFIYKDASEQINFETDEAGSTITLTGATALSLNTWYHVVIVGISTEYGIYIDGVQDAYRSGSMGSTKFGTAGFAILSDVSGTWPMSGQMALARITHDNFFSLAPNVGLTDTYTVPWDYLKDDGTYNADFVLRETGGFILQENGDKIII
jgi:hypothetical protein